MCTSRARDVGAVHSPPLLAMAKKGGRKAAKNAVPPEPGEKYSLAVLKAKAKAKEAKMVLLDEAAAWCIDNNKSPHDAVKLEKFAGLKHEAIRYRLKRSQRSERAILTDIEKERLYTWLKKSADKGAVIGEKALGDKILQMLTARLKRNRAAKHGAGCVRLSNTEANLLRDNKHPSHTWLTNFKAHAAIHGIDFKVARPKDAKRHKKQTEAVVEKHFRGEFGLEAELLATNNLDPVTKEIIDPRRLLNMDEMPQFLDYLAKGIMQRGFGRSGVALEASTSENRECATLCTAADASGFLYGMQAIVSRKNLITGWGDCVEAPDWAPCFDDQMYLLDGKSTHSLMSITDGGVQTKESFMAFLTSLSEQIKQRSAAEVAAGKSAIEMPVTLMLDNHSSRFDETILAATSRDDLTADAANLGIRLFFEESMTSHFLQMLDKVFEKLHRAYKAGCNEYKKQSKSKYGDEPDIGIPEFLEILGGCADLNLAGIWFSWCSRTDIITAWRHVGVCANKFDTSQIDRSKFIDKEIEEEAAAHRSPTRQTRQQTDGNGPDPHATPTSIEDAEKTPIGMRSDDVEALKIKLGRMKKLAKRSIEIGFDPATVPGLMDPQEPDKKRRKRDQSRAAASEGGSASLRNLHGQAVEKREASQREQAEKDERKRLAEEKKKEAADAVRKLEAAWNRCARACKCRQTPCAMAGFKKCATCGEIKKRVCTKAECVKARTDANAAVAAD